MMVSTLDAAPAPDSGYELRYITTRSPMGRLKPENLENLSSFLYLLDSLRQQRSPDCSIMPDVMTLEKSKKDRGDRQGRPASSSFAIDILRGASSQRHTFVDTGIPAPLSEHL